MILGESRLQIDNTNTENSNFQKVDYAKTEQIHEYAYYTENKPDKPLNWHKFIIYFSLWAGALRTLLNGSEFLKEDVYGRNTYRIYKAFPIMHTMNTFYGWVIIALAGYKIYVRFQLAGFKKNAPQKFIYMYIIEIFIGLSYLAICATIANTSISKVINSGEFFGKMVVAIIIILINKRYYDNRKYMFVN